MTTTSISKNRLQEIVGRFSNTSILVIGDIMLDEYWWGEVTRISPEAPVPIVEVASTTVKLGGAANVAANLKSLGLSPELISVTGSDANGARLRSLIDEAGMNSDGIMVSKNRPTTLKTRILASHQQVVRADHESCADLDNHEFDAVLNQVNKLLPQAKAVILSDYAKGVLSHRTCKSVIDSCKKKGVFIAVDPKKRFFEDYDGASLITPNLKEAFQALGMPPTPYKIDEVTAIGWQLLDKNKLPLLLITLGEKGMALFEADGRRFTHLETAAKKVYDVTGAGDTVIGCFTAAMAVGATPVEAAFLANHAAGLTVAEIGTATVTQEQLLRAI